MKTMPKYMVFKHKQVSITLFFFCLISMAKCPMYHIGCMTLPVTLEIYKFTRIIISVTYIAVYMFLKITLVYNSFMSWALEG